MKFAKKVTVEIACTLDSSELVMLNQGGLHKVDVPSGLFASAEDDHDWSEASQNKCFISIQLARGEQVRFDHVTANKHK